jgi:lipid-A-disaccharide synthase
VSSVSKSVLIVAGESSGDIHGAELAQALRADDPDVRIYSAGGDRLAAVSQQIMDLTVIAVTGLVSVVRDLPRILRLFDSLVNKIEEVDPDIIVLVDFPDFNLRLARKVRKKGRRIVYFISPQLWAWRKGRIKIIKKFIDKMLVIFPFEPAFYRRHGVDAVYVGNPLVNTMKALAAMPRPETGAAKTVLLLPGSREREVRFHLEPMVEAAVLLRQLQTVRCVVCKHPRLDASLFAAAEAAGVEVTEQTDYSLFRQADVAIAASGTVTFELALLQVPTVVIYRLDYLSFVILRALVNIPYMAMINLIMDKEVFPELLQYEAEADRIADKANKLLTDKGVLGRINSDLQRFLELMTPFDPVRASREILTLERD